MSTKGILQDKRGFSGWRLQMAAVSNVVAMSLVAGIVVCSPCFGDTSSRPKSTGIAEKVNNNEILEAAEKKMRQAIAVLEKKIADCDDNGRMKTILPRHAIPAIPLSDQEWDTALTHLSTKAVDRCIGHAWSEALMAFTQFKNFEKQLTGVNVIDTSPYTLELLCCASELGKLKTELEYQKIEPKIRQVLEGIPELAKPFNPIATRKTTEK